jgi:hypothetical protein
MTLAMKYSKPPQRAKAPEVDDLARFRPDERRRIRTTITPASVAVGCGIASLLTVTVLVGLAAYSCSQITTSTWWQRQQPAPLVPVHGYPSGITITNTYSQVMRNVKVTLHARGKTTPGEIDDYTCSAIPVIQVGETYWIMPTRFVAMSGQRWNPSSDKSIWVDVSYKVGSNAESFSTDL